MINDLLDHQPTRSGKQREPRRFDRTQLRESDHGKRLSRDYAAHYFRWGWVNRRLFQKENQLTVLDIGCGQDLPFFYVMASISHRQMLPALYVGVDLNPLPTPSSPWARFKGGFCIHDNWRELLDEHTNHQADIPCVVCPSVTGYDRILCLECLEHMSEEDGLSLLKIAHHLLKPEGEFYLSTPVYDGVAKAVNHIHEYTITELREKVEWAGFKVVKRFGTFINKLDLKRVASPTHWKAYEDIEEFYGGELAANFLAPCYPDQARNNLWVLKRTNNVK